MAIFQYEIRFSRPYFLKKSRLRRHISCIIVSDTLFEPVSLEIRCYKIAPEKSKVKKSTMLLRMGTSMEDTNEDPEARPGTHKSKVPR